MATKQKKPTSAERVVAANQKLVEIKALVLHEQRGYSPERIAVMAGTTTDHVTKWLRRVKVQRAVY